MKQLSESLDDPAARDRRLEESVTAAGEADRTTLEKRRREAENAFESAMDCIEAAVGDAGDTARERWNDTIAAVTRQIEVMRAARRRWQAELAGPRGVRVHPHRHGAGGAGVAAGSPSMIDFGDTMVREVMVLMVPRPDRVTVPAAATVREALDLAVAAGVSRLPALDPTVDEIAGVVDARALLRSPRGRAGR